MKTGHYKPSNVVIELAQLNAALALGQSVIDGVTTGLIGWKGNVNFRENQYLGVGKLATRVSAAFAACGATDNSIEDMKGFVRKIAGARKKKLVVDDPNTAINEAAHNSVSQRSYTQSAEHFDAIIEMCMNEPLYSRNEVGASLTDLQTRYQKCISRLLTPDRFLWQTMRFCY